MSKPGWKAVRPLRHRDYRLLWTGLAVALLGSGLWLVALAWQVIELGGGPVQLSVVTTAYSIGLLVCVLFGGIAADRLSQRSVIVVADSVRGVVLLGLAALALIGLLEIWHLATAAVLVGAGEAFLIPAYTAWFRRPRKLFSQFDDALLDRLPQCRRRVLLQGRALLL